MAEPRIIIDIIVRLRDLVGAGSKSDRLLASMVLSDLDFSSKASISDIATRVGVSEPTVTRFCRNLGCEGVRDFKFWIAQAMAIGGQYLSAQPVNNENDDQRLIEAISDPAIAAIRALSSTLVMPVINAVAQQLCGSGRILCIGSGGTSSMLATEMQNRLFRLGLDAVAQVDGELQRMFAAVATSNTTVLAFSTSGYARSVIDAVRLARQYGAQTVAITAPGSPLSEVASVVIHYLPVEDGNIYKPTPSRFALLAIVDILATAVAESRGSEVLENLRRIKQSLNMLKREDPRLPLGD